MQKELKKPLRCKLGLHKWYHHNSTCIWGWFYHDLTCLGCGKYEFMGFDCGLGLSAEIMLSQSLQYGPQSGLDVARQRYANKQKSWFLHHYLG